MKRVLAKLTRGEAIKRLILSSLLLLIISLTASVLLPIKAISSFSDENSPFGKHFIGYWDMTSGEKEKTYQAYKDAGVKWIRWGGSANKQKLVCWERVQPTKESPWRWEENDREIALLKSYGFLLISNLETPEGPKSNCVPGWVGSLSDAERKKYFQRWVKAVVGRYGSQGNGTIKHWEIVAEYQGENPSPAKLVEIIKTTYQIIKVADPKATVWIDLAGSPTEQAVTKEKEGQKTWVSGIFDGKGLEKYTDILTFHRYGLEEDLIKTIKAIDWIINNPDFHLAGKQVWITEGKEWSSWLGGQPPDEKTQAEELRKRYNIALGKTKIPGVTIKINKVFWSGNLIDKDTLELTPSFFAYQELANPNGPTCPLFNKGDANCDNQVDELDYAIWWDNYKTGIGADFNSDGKTDEVDYTIWWKYYGNSF